MTRKNPIELGGYYHVYNRGVEKRNIFLNDADKNRFVRMLYLCNSTKPIVYKLVQDRDLDKVDIGSKIVAIGAYCLMDNHFHLLLKEIVEGGLAKFMEKLSVGYSMYFNKKNDRTGALFEGRYKARQVDTEEYLKYTFAYIHLNPIKRIEPNWKEVGIKDRKRAIRYLSTYPYSSYLDLVGQGKDRMVSLVNHEEFPQYFPNSDDFTNEIMEWIEYGQTV